MFDLLKFSQFSVDRKPIINSFGIKHKLQELQKADAVDEHLRHLRRLIKQLPPLTKKVKQHQDLLWRFAQIEGFCYRGAGGLLVDFNNLSPALQEEHIRFFGGPILVERRKGVYMRDGI